MLDRQQGTDSLAGSLLLAHPAMQDPNFRRAVILLSAHDDKGALGIMLNRPMAKRLDELDQAFAADDLAEIRVFCGGPVQTDRLIICAMAIHPDNAGLRLHFGLEPDKAKSLIQEHGDDLRLRAFVGHSGWAPGQLESELQQNTWAVSAIPDDLLSRPPDEILWQDVISDIGPEWKLLAHAPEDPQRN